MIDTAEKAPIKYSFPDYTKFVGQNLTDEYEIIKFLTDTVIHIIDGGSHKVFTHSKLEDGAIKFKLTDANLFLGANDFHFQINSENKTMY